MILTRRNLITGLSAFIAAPAIVRASSLMAVKPVEMGVDLALGPSVTVHSRRLLVLRNETTLIHWTSIEDPMHWSNNV